MGFSSKSQWSFFSQYLVVQKCRYETPFLCMAKHHKGVDWSLAKREDNGNRVLVLDKKKRNPSSYCDNNNTSDHLKESM